MPPIADLVLTDEVIQCVEPTPAYDSFEWICDHITMPDGEPFNEDKFPWTRGICEAFDSPSVRLVAMQFAARLGKTATAQALHVCHIVHKPGPSLFGSSTEQLLKQIMKKKLLKILRETAATKHLVPPDHKLLQTRLDLDLMTIYGSWSGSPTTMADIDPLFLHGNEIDKWTKDASEEGDALDLFLERGIERRDRKAVVESTPGITSASRINRILLNGWNCRWHVPCWWCRYHFKLQINESDDPRKGGIWWDRMPNGSHPPPEDARASARYICPGCHKEIDDQFRRPMIRRGVWVPFGQRATKKGRLAGAPVNKGPNATYQLSRLYAPTFTFGDVAAKYCEVHGDLRSEHNFQNSWMGETFTPRRGYEDWETIAKRLCVGPKIGVIRPEVDFLTASVDMQIDHMVWMVFGWWAAKKVGDVLGWGVAEDWDELWSYLPRERIDAKNKSCPLRMVLVDSRFRRDEVLEACRQRSRRGFRVFPMMGVRQLRRPFSKQPMTDDRRMAPYDVQLISVNTPFWQEWLDGCLVRRRPGETDTICFPPEARDDRDLWEQILNETVNEKGIWVPVDEHTPVDFRDTLRYGRVAAEVFTNGAWARVPARHHNIIVPRPDEPHQMQRQSTWMRRKKIKLRN